MAKQFFSWRTAILQSDLQSTTKHVLLTLSCHMNDAGQSCYPSIETLCKETSLSNRAVISHLKMANDLGWVITRKHGLAGQKWARNDYEISWPNSSEGGELGSLPSENGEKELSGCSDNNDIEGAEKVVNEVHHLKGKGSEPHTKGSEPDDQKAVNQVHTSTSVNSTQSTPTSVGAKPDAKRIWNSMLEGCGIDPIAKPTKPELEAWQKAHKNLMAVETTSDEIMTRCAAFRRKWPRASLTPFALVRRWSECTAQAVIHKTSDWADIVKRGRSLGIEYEGVVGGMSIHQAKNAFIAKVVNAENRGSV